MANFKYYTGSTWADVPDLAHPEDESGSIRLKYPEATDRDGNGAPCGIIGLPTIEIASETMQGTGWDFWQAFFADEVAETAEVSLQVFNERAGNWLKYAGDLLRPRCESVRPGSTALATTYNGVALTVINAAEIAAPTIISDPDNATALIGETATFDVAAVGSEPKTYQWRVNDGGGYVNVSTGTGGTTNHYTTGTLAGTDNGNLYQCVVTNAYGSDTSAPATLTVTSTLVSKVAAYWDFYSDATDAAGTNDATGTIAGYTGNVANFVAASSQYLEGGSSIDSYLGGTIWGWVSIGALPGSGSAYIVGTTDSVSNNHAGFAVKVSSSGTIGISVTTGSGSPVELNLRGNPDTNKLFFAFAIDLANDLISGWSSRDDDQNLTLNAATPVALTLTPTDTELPIMFGKSNTIAANYLDGTLQSVGWSSEILTEDDITTLYNDNTPLRYAGL